MTTYQCGATVLGLVDADEVFGAFPRSIYSPGARVQTGAGTIRHRGYPLSTWVFDVVAVDDWDTAKTALASGAFSGECYVVTRDDEDTFSTYRAQVRFPDPGERVASGEHYLNVRVEFLLVEVIP